MKRLNSSPHLRNNSGLVLKFKDLHMELRIGFLTKHVSWYISKKSIWQSIIWELFHLFENNELRIFKVIFFCLIWVQSYVVVNLIDYTLVKIMFEACSRIHYSSSSDYRDYKICCNYFFLTKSFYFFFVWIMLSRISNHDCFCNSWSNQLYLFSPTL